MRRFRNLEGRIRCATLREMKESLRKPPILLVAEDDPSFVELVRQVFQEPPAWEIFWVLDGEAALDFLFRRRAYAQAARPDVFLLSIRMPKKTGLEVLEEIKAVPELASIPVVMWTVSTCPEHIALAYKLGVAGYFAKPALPQAMLAQLRINKAYWDSAMLPHECQA